MTQSSKRLFFVILMVGTLTQICTDMYTPSLPAIAHGFLATYGQSQLTLTLFMLGVAITNLIYGPLSEGIGRRWTLVIGTVIGLAGTAVCFFAQSIEMLQVGRLIQGAGLGAATALWRTIFRDGFSGDELASIASYFTNVVIISVILAPFLGGYFEHYFGWRATFLFLIVWIAIVLCVLLFVFKESGQHHGKHRLNIKFVIAAFGELLTSRVFMGFTLCAFFTYGGLFSWLTAGPVVLIHGAGITPVMFGWLSVPVGIIIMLAGNINGRYVKKLTSRKMMQIGWAMMIVGGLLTLGAYYIYGTSLYSVFLPTLLVIFGSMLVFSNTFACAFDKVGHIAGYAGALYSAIQLAGGVLFSAIISHLNTATQLPMALLFVASGVLSWIVYKLVAEK